MKNEIGTQIAEAAVLNDIYEIVKNTDKSGYRKIIEEKAAYPYIYHLADIRANIVEWLPITKDMSVLEIGAECGALTECLAEKAEKVTYLTDLKIQDNIIRTRVEKNVKNPNKNIEGYVGNFKEYESQLGQYDMIIMAGTFGYAFEMVQGEPKDPFLVFLDVLKEHLKPEGSAIIADVNRLGLKYFAGCQDEHSGGYFVNIENHITGNQYRTFTKKEYTGLLQQAGYNNVNFYYPYPDYKFPTVIYSDEYLPKSGELNDNRRNIDRDRYLFFNELYAYNTLITEGLFQEFSNSFLIRAYKGRAD